MAILHMDEAHALQNDKRERELCVSERRKGGSEREDKGTFVWYCLVLRLTDKCLSLLGGHYDHNDHLESVFLTVDF